MSCFRKIFFLGLLWWPSLPGWRPKPGPSRHLGAPPVGRARRTLAPPFGSGDRCSAITKNPQKNKKIKLYLGIRERAKSERLTLPELGDRFWRSWGRVLVHFEAWSPGGGSGCSDWPDPQSRRYSQGTGRFLSEAESQPFCTGPLQAIPPRNAFPDFP